MRWIARMPTSQSSNNIGIAIREAPEEYYQMLSEPELTATGGSRRRDIAYSPLAPASRRSAATAAAAGSGTISISSSRRRQTR